ncbi:UPAR/Ly6 domain-containing protein CG9338 [Megachile rotundata]|uniref:UPAR/Ly6 domain-containing protein CG9338 n=1 Tax=Megachile rotundata TaxID=143995 RepID=UPI000614C66E|nr:PREDICTED: uncharacterized protein LOC105661848 [Megachile rotundata]
MLRRISVLIVSFALVFVVRSDENVKCYMCTSLTHPGCDTDPKTPNIKMEKCTLDSMSDMQKIVQQHNDLRNISYIFDVDNTQQYHAPATMACAKMVLKVKGKDVTVRNCQTAKAETIDPCKAIQRKFSNDISLEFCELCMHDACNGSTIVTPELLLNLVLVLGTVILRSFYNHA